jgi:hypothetical protein
VNKPTSPFGTIDFNFKEHFQCKVIRNDQGDVRGGVLTTEGLRQLNNFLFWKNRKLPAHEFDGWKYSERILEHIKSAQGKFLHDGIGYHILLGTRRITIDAASEGMKRLLLDTCHITSLSREAAVAVERLRMAFRLFSAMYDGPEPRVYLPLAVNGKILRVMPDGIDVVPNGDNGDQLWLEHPESNPLEWSGTPTTEQVQEGLVMFEKLLVETQACTSLSMKWFVAMAEGLFPIVRDAAENRFIMLHTGDQGSGKTTGSKSFRLVHGFNDVLFDVSVAGLSSLPEQGLVVIDNKEQSDFSAALVNYFLSAATGGERIRASSDGASVRRTARHPVAVITSIEGVCRNELYDRCVEVKYALAKDQPRIDRDELEDKITAARTKISSALVVAVQEYLWVRGDPSLHIDVKPIDRFNRHFREVCYLLIAFGRLMYGDEGGTSWAMKHIAAWGEEIRKNRKDGDAAPVSALEGPILHAIRNGECEFKTLQGFQFHGQHGTLYVLFPGELLHALQRQHTGLKLPVDAGGMGRRLHNDREQFQRFHVVFHDSDDSTAQKVLSRKNSGQPVGIFIPGEEPEEPGGGGETVVV